MDDKIFELMTKMYSEMKESFMKVDERLSKLEIGQEKMRDDIKTLSEVQESHMNENERHHIEIVELLSGKITNVENAVRKISAVK